jgi:membrane-associated phospholipid phosphatase
MKNIITYPIMFLFLVNTAIFAGLDSKLFLKINGARNVFFDACSWTINKSSLFPPVAFTGLWIHGAANNHQGNRGCGMYGCAAMAQAFAANQGLKIVFRRQRPIFSVPGARGVYRHSGFVKRILKSEQYSFPSQAASMAFASSVMLGDRYPKARPLLYTWSVLVCWSRIYRGAHYPGDVLAGALLGLGVGGLTLWIKEQNGD